LAIKNLVSKFNFEVLKKKTIEVLKKNKKLGYPSLPVKVSMGPKIDA